jgi:hypothetical protein
VQGHDIKSIARELAISTSATNERLRSARAKLGVSSSREAARILTVQENSPNFRVDRLSGLVTSGDASHPRRTVLLWSGVIMAITIATGLALMAIVGANRGEAAAPTVVRTSPAAGSVVRPGPLKLSVTFDRPMQAGSFSFVQKDPATYPDCGRNMPSQSKDGRTFTLACNVKSGRSYEIWFNSPPYMNFRDRSGRSATPFGLRFRTSER